MRSRKKRVERAFHPHAELFWDQAILEGMEEQVRIEAIELNQNSSSNRHPNGGQHGRGGKIGQKVFHGTSSL